MESKKTTVAALRWALMAGLAGMLLAGSGCQTVPPPEIEIREHPRMMARPFGKKPHATPQATAETRALRVQFKATVANAETLKRALTSRVEGTLAAAGYKVMHSGTADIEVVADIRARERNKRGSRVAWVADTDVRVFRSARPEAVVSRSWVDVKSGDARSADDALKALAERLADEIAPFAGSAVQRIARDLHRVEVIINRAWASPEAALYYPDIFTKTVGQISGVYACHVVSMDELKGMHAEVVYDDTAFPDGFLNRLKATYELGLVAPLQ